MQKLREIKKRRERERLNLKNETRREKRRSAGKKMREGKKKFNGAPDVMDIIVLGGMDVDNDDVTYLKTVNQLLLIHFSLQVLQHPRL